MGCPQTALTACHPLPPPLQPPSPLSLLCFLFRCRQPTAASPFCRFPAFQRNKVKTSNTHPFNSKFSAVRESPRQNEFAKAWKMHKVPKSLRNVHFCDAYSLLSSQMSLLLLCLFSLFLCCLCLCCRCANYCCFGVSATLSSLSHCLIVVLIFFVINVVVVVFFFLC